MIAGQCRDLRQRVATRRKGGATKTLPTLFDAYTTEIVIPPQVRAGRALLGWSQEDLARRAGVAITTVRDVEGEKRAETAAAGEVVRALQDGGVEIVPGSSTSGPGVRLAKNRPNVIRSRYQ